MRHRHPAKPAFGDGLDRLARVPGVAEVLPRVAAELARCRREGRSRHYTVVVCERVLRESYLPDSGIDAAMVAIFFAMVDTRLLQDFVKTSQIREPWARLLTVASVRMGDNCGWRPAPRPRPHSHMPRGRRARTRRVTRAGPSRKPDDPHPVARRERVALRGHTALYARLPALSLLSARGGVPARRSHV